MFNNRGDSAIPPPTEQSSEGVSWRRIYEIQEASTVIERLKNGEIVEQDILLKLTKRLVSALDAMKVINRSLRHTWENTLNSVSTRLKDEWGIADIEAQIN